MNAPPDAADVVDHLVVGSGFGGAVAALRLAEAGLRVVVLERGREVDGAAIAAAKRSARRLYWYPRAGLRGFFWQRTYRHLGVIGGTGVGGGSLVFGGVLLEPPATFYDDPVWEAVGVDLATELPPHLATAARMLGRVTNPALGRMDDHLRATAASMGVGHTFGPVPLAITFGPPGVLQPDPHLGGDGPDREGCRLCGGCLTGCPYGAKNSLDRNYLHLARRRGAEILAEHEVTRITPRPEGGYEVTTRHPWRPRSTRRFRARHVVLAAGVLGTLELLLRARDEHGTLPRLSATLGRDVRTNSEAITGVLADDVDLDLAGDGPAISSDFHPDAATHVTQNRLAPNQGILRFALGPLTDGVHPGRRARATLAAVVRHPVATWRTLTARRFTARTSVLTVMRHDDSRLAFRLGRSVVRPWRRVLRTVGVPGHRSPSYLPVANDATRRFAASLGGRPLNMLVESVGGRAFTAHVLGGCGIAADAEGGVIGADHQVHGHPGLYVVDASAIPANLGVNPSLTITALAERWAADHLGAASAAGTRPGGTLPTDLDR